MADLLTSTAPRDEGLDGTPGGGGRRRLGAPLARLVLTRVLASVAVLWGAVTATFFLLELMHGNTVDVLLAQSQAGPEVRAEIISRYHLDDPLPVRYFAYLGRVLRGDFGESYMLRKPVWQAITEQLPDTLVLVATTVLTTVVASVLFAALSATRRRSLRSVVAAVESLVVAVPPFWLGLVLLTVFSFWLHWFPAIGSSAPAGLVLPTIALAAGPVAVTTRVLREGMVRALDEPFVMTARTRGISEPAVRLRHTLRHALLPATALLGWISGSLIGGAIIIETVFSRRGMGRLVLSAVQNRDMPVVIGIVLVAATTFVIITVLVDILTWFIDPRTRT
ncbi:ABC transporter permease [Frankia sp. QA3]|uniref:ABC transporter permease n=1 Tax=Frankia sp. QA3 TaxID=710111 RepID=UPI000269C18B|nr:ABC transporter permease [Frankia sp. QA3]EIV92561.1 ABC-type dipeptide/oligopeptide/nickel transport system, permease component [Frankia sp. QA3]